MNIKYKKEKMNKKNKKHQPVVEMTHTESLIVQKSKNKAEKLTQKEVSALKKIIERVEKQN